MKNQIIALSVILAITFIIASCGSNSTTQQTYQCPMKCEGEKTYKKPGSCPVCKMDLQVVEGSHEQHHHDSTHLNH